MFRRNNLHYIYGTDNVHHIPMIPLYHNESQSKSEYHLRYRYHSTARVSFHFYNMPPCREGRNQNPRHIVLHNSFPRFQNGCRDISGNRHNSLLHPGCNCESETYHAHKKTNRHYYFPSLITPNIISVVILINYRNLPNSLKVSKNSIIQIPQTPVQKSAQGLFLLNSFFQFFPYLYHSKSIQTTIFQKLLSHNFYFFW